MKTGSSPAVCAYDVYCFGKVLLEIVTGKVGISASNDAEAKEWMERTLPFISIYNKDHITKIVDPSMAIGEDLLEEVWAVAIIARCCLNPKASSRPQMRFVLKALEDPHKVTRGENYISSARLRAAYDVRVVQEDFGALRIAEGSDVSWLRNRCN